MISTHFIFIILSSVCCIKSSHSLNVEHLWLKVVVKLGLDVNVSGFVPSREECVSRSECKTLEPRVPVGY